MRPARRIALFAAPLALALSAGPVFAGTPDVNVTLLDGDGKPAAGPVCEFSFEFGPLGGGETGSWELYDSGHDQVARGTYEVTSTAGDVQPPDGPLSMPDGEYVLWWDDETPVDSSRRELPFTVSCPQEASMSPSASPSESSTAAPSASSVPSPSTSSAPIPSGTVEAETGTPVAEATPRATLPPTDTEGGTSAPAWPMAMLTLALAAAASVLTVGAASARRNR